MATFRVMQHPLRRLRTRAALSLDQVAEMTGISKASLSRIETGGQNPSFSVIRTLIDFSRGYGRPLSAEHFVNFENSQ